MERIKKKLGSGEPNFKLGIVIPYKNCIYYTSFRSKKKGESMEKEFKKTRALVKDILEKEPYTRNSDMALYIKVVERLNKNALNKPFWEVLSNLEDLGLPCFETVRRNRQKIQELYPELQANEKVQDFRTEREMEFRKEFGRC